MEKNFLKFLKRENRFSKKIETIHIKSPNSLQQNTFNPEN